MFCFLLALVYATDSAGPAAGDDDDVIAEDDSTKSGQTFAPLVVV